MALIDPSTTREFLEALVAGFSVLGGVMAYWSGLRAAQTYAQGLPADELAFQINAGIAEGFTMGAPLAVFALIIMAWT